MKPVEISEALRGIADRIDASTNPSRTIIINDLKKIITTINSAKPRFEETYCSQCGHAFGPGDSGYSECSSHEGKKSTGR